MSTQEKQLYALFERGNNFMRMGNMTQAAKDYDQVLAQWPTFYPAYFNRAFARQHGLGDLANALTDYNQAITLKPDFTEAYANRALLHHQQGDYQLAIQDYSTALGHNPEMAVVYVNRGEAYALLQEFANAQADFAQARTLKAGYRNAIAGEALCRFVIDADDPMSVTLWEALLNMDDKFRDSAWVAQELGWDAALIDLAQGLISQF